MPAMWPAFVRATGTLHGFAVTPEARARRATKAAVLSHTQAAWNARLCAALDSAAGLGFRIVVLHRTQSDRVLDTRSFAARAFRRVLRTALRGPAGNDETAEHDTAEDVTVTLSLVKGSIVFGHFASIRKDCFSTGDAQPTAACPPTPPPVPVLAGRRWHFDDALCGEFLEYCRRSNVRLAHKNPNPTLPLVRLDVPLDALDRPVVLEKSEGHETKHLLSPLVTPPLVEECDAFLL